MSNSTAVLGEEEIRVKIAWISDIHLRHSYSDKPRVQVKIQPFLDGCIKTLSKEENLDYILFSGDLAFSGSKEDYNFFWDSIVKKLHEELKPPYPKILTIPGNHDISWNSTEQFRKYLKTYNETTRSFGSRNEKLNDKSGREQFYDSFRNYSERFGENDDNKKLKEWSDMFSLSDENLEVYKDYNSNRLFGYVIDHSKQIIFILFNSAWYSIGEKFNELLAEYAYNEKKGSRNEKKALPRGTKRNISFKPGDMLDLLRKKDSISEYGNQIIGRDLFPVEITEKINNELSHYVVLTCMHHPLNWLNWNEIYNYDGTVNRAFTLNKILSVSDALLSGHEHIPIFQKAEKITEIIKDNKVGLLKAGMFMEDQLDVREGEPFFSHSRFSIMDVDMQKSLLSERKFLFDEEVWEEKTNLKDELQLRKKNRYLASITKDDYIASIKDFQVKEYLVRKRKIIKEVSDVSEELCEENEHYKIFKLAYNNCHRFCILPLTYNFYDDVLTRFDREYFIDRLLERFYREGYEVSIHFIWLDLIVKETFTQDYTDPQRQRDFNEILSEITRYSDLNFNKFRHYFFERIEEGKSNIRFDLVKDLRFINEVVRFWHFKKYI